MVQKAIVLVGGFGTRLRPLSCTRPKALFPVANVPLLERVVRALAEGGVEEVILAVNYQADLIEAKLGAGEKFNLRIKYSREKHPLGTAGPLWYARDELRDSGPFFMLNGDVILNYDNELFEKHVFEFPMTNGRRWYDRDPFSWLVINALKYADEDLITDIILYLKEKL